MAPPPSRVGRERSRHAEACDPQTLQEHGELQNILRCLFVSPLSKPEGLKGITWSRLIASARNCLERELWRALLIQLMVGVEIGRCNVTGDMQKLPEWPVVEGCCQQQSLQRCLAINMHVWGSSEVIPETPKRHPRS